MGHKAIGDAMEKEAVKVSEAAEVKKEMQEKMV